MRLVLDTNAVLDLFVFEDPGARSLKEALDAARVTAVATEETLAELRRVLAYPAFGLDEAKQAAAYEGYRGLCEIVPVPPSSPILPRCTDPDDQKFLDLALAAKAAYVVTKDKALLKLARRIARLDAFSVTALTDMALPSA